ncbi:MAG TPA: serine/threonine-protein kinase [Myxococcales bacterium]|nr:serine/threonine-protein kinase [Myxococcales bacterium]
MRQPLKFGKYLLLERIAVGGMAEVYAAKSFGVEGFERILAIKKILPTMGEDPEFVSMFVDEARIAVQLSHANIVQVLELGKHDDSLYIAMEYVAGRDVRQLAQQFRRRGLPLPVPQACAIVARACEALDHAHRKCDVSGKPLGIVHRDVSPQNVLVSFTGDVKLIDFGIAKAETRMQRTQSGALKGKFSYMSPEQVQGQPIDRRSDVFSVGVLLWELLCGRKLFTADSDLALLDKVRRADVPPPRSLNAEVSEALDAVVLKALAPDRDRRYQWCSELHDDLVRFAVAGDTVLGTRRLGEWMREEFSAEYESEQARMREWLAVRVPPSSAVPAHAATTIPALADAGVARALVRDTAEWRVIPEREGPERESPDRDTLPDPTSGTKAQPTIVLRPGEARVPVFDNASDQTAARRVDRHGPLSRPRPRDSFLPAWFLATVPAAVALAAGAAYLVLWLQDVPSSPPAARRVAESSIGPAARVGAQRASARVGYLVTSTNPAARVTIDGRATGRWTPVPEGNPIALSPGAHTIVFETQDGQQFEETLEIEQGKTARLVRNLASIR